MSAPAESSSAKPAGDERPSPQDNTQRLQQPQDAVAMESMPKTTSPPAAAAGNDDSKPEPAPADQTLPPASATAAAASSSSAPEPVPSDSKAPEPLVKERQAIGAAVDDIRAVDQDGPDAGPVCNITLLLTSGSRHPYKLDAKYLSRRHVDIPEQTENGQPDPFSISVYTLKELILREWRNDWETKPASPSSIRLIHFGKLLDDKEPLKKYQLSAQSPNVVHMSIRPQDLDEEEPKSGSKNMSSGSGDGQRQRSSGCCIVL